VYFKIRRRNIKILSYILIMIEVYTDGSCLGNPGPGGWAYLIENVIGRGGSKITTNNIMEMTAVIKALEKCIEMGYDTVTIYTDSNYVKLGLLEWSRIGNGMGGKRVKVKMLRIRIYGYTCYTCCVKLKTLK